MARTLQLTTHSPEETQSLGKALGRVSQPGDLYLLSGPLGAGKTCLVQGLAFGLGVEEYARSPSFVLVNRYRGRLDIHHIDLYRLQEAEEVIDLGLEEYFEGAGVCAVEWPERGASLFPQEHLSIDIEYGTAENDRNIRIEARGNRYLELLRTLGNRLSVTEGKCC